MYTAIAIFVHLGGAPLDPPALAGASGGVPPPRPPRPTICKMDYSPTTAIVYPQSQVSAAAMILLCYSLMLQSSRGSAIFTMLAAVVRIYSTLTDGASITRLDNMLAAAGQKTPLTTRRRLLTAGASITRFRNFHDACSSSAYI